MALDGARTVMAALVDMFASGDPARAESVVAVDYLDHQGLGAGPLRGVEGFRHLVAVARQGFVALDAAVLDAISEGDRSVARIGWRGTLTSGELVARETIDIGRVVKGPRWPATPNAADRRPRTR